MEQLTLSLYQSGIAVELLCAAAADGTQFYGVRLRPFGRNLPRTKMIVAAGNTFEEALINAVEKAESRRWEALDWSIRPWSNGTDHAKGGSYGLDAR
jgi:hypothetical protein